jgi:hypothetical protein
MAPISSDKALPSKKPDVPTIKYIIGMSLVFGLLSTLQTMIYYHRPNLWDVPNEYDTGQHVDYDKVKHDTQIEFNSHRHANVWDVRSSATYVQISIAVELLIFSCRTTGWFFMDMPSLGLVSGVMIANVIVSVCAVYGVIVTPRLDWNWVGNIWIYNIGCLFIIDCVKIFVNKMIGNSHDDILGYSDIPDENNENVRGTYGGVSENGPRSSVRRSSVLNRPSRQIQNRYSRLSNVDYGGAARASVASRSSNLRRNVPGNVAQDFDNIARASMAGGETSFWQGW